MIATKSGSYYARKKADLQVSPGLDKQQVRFYDEMIALNIPNKHPRFDNFQYAAGMMSVSGTPSAHWRAKHQISSVIGNVEQFASMHTGICPGSSYPIGDLLRRGYPQFFQDDIFYRLDALDVYALDVPSVRPVMAKLRELADRYAKELGVADAEGKQEGFSPKKSRTERLRRYQAVFASIYDPLRDLLNDLCALCDHYRRASMQS